MKTKDISQILEMHCSWIKGDGGMRANLSDANLSGANLSDANLSRANLSRAKLYGANLYGANLSDANLSRANLSRANLPDANLSGANLSDAKLSRANLSRANLYGANLSDANLYGANLSECSDLIYASITYSGFGERGRLLTAAIINNELLFFCGCFQGTEHSLLKYIEDGDDKYKASRTKGMEILMDLINEQRSEICGEGE